MQEVFLGGFGRWEVGVGWVGLSEVSRGRRPFKIVSDWLDGAVGDDDADRWQLTTPHQHHIGQGDQDDGEGRRRRRQAAGHAWPTVLHDIDPNEPKNVQISKKSFVLCAAHAYFGSYAQDMSLNY